MIDRIIILLVATFAPAATFNTPSGKPEVVIAGRPVQEVYQALATFVQRGKGVKIVRRTADSITTEKLISYEKRTNGWTQKLGKRIYQFVEDKGSVRIVCTSKIYFSFGGSQASDEWDNTSGEGGPSCQQTLDKFKGTFK